MLLNEMMIGRPLEIFVTREGYHYRVVSKIEHVSDGCACVTPIASKTRVFEFLETYKIDLVYREEEKMWKWRSVVGGMTEVSGQKLHCFYSEEEGESFNRRNAYRVFVGEKLVVEYLVYDAKHLRDFDLTQELHSEMVFNYDPDADAMRADCFRYVECRAVLKDISEDGAGLYMDQKLEPGDEITFDFQTKDFGVINCRARIVRRLESRQGSFRYYYGCRFKETSRNLSKYIYEMQRKQLRKARKQK